MTSVNRVNLKTFEVEKIVENVQPQCENVAFFVQKEDSAGYSILIYTNQPKNNIEEYHFSGKKTSTLVGRYSSVQASWVEQATKFLAING